MKANDQSIQINSNLIKLEQKKGGGKAKNDFAREKSGQINAKENEFFVR